MIHKKSKLILHSKKKSKKKNHNKKTRVINKRSTNITRKNKKTQKVKKTPKKIMKKTRKQNLNNIIGGKVVTGIFTREQELESPFKDNLMNKFKYLIKVKMQQLKYNDNEIEKIEGKLNYINLNKKKEFNKIFNEITIEDNNKKPKKLNKILDNIYLKIPYKKKQDDQNNTNKLFLYVTLLFIKQNLKRIRKDILDNFVENNVLIYEEEYKNNKSKFKKYSFTKHALISPTNWRWFT